MSEIVNSYQIGTLANHNINQLSLIFNPHNVQSQLNISHQLNSYPLVLFIVSTMNA